MSEKMDQFASELLDKTRTGSPDWIRIETGDQEEEEYSLDLGEGYRFHVLSTTSGDDRSILLQLYQNQRILDESSARNWLSLVGQKTLMDSERVKRFRLYSDLVDSVRECVPSRKPEKEFGEVEELLRKIS